jgi:hypothetical protein
VAADLLVVGDNILAVEIHQCNRTSSDISFDLELVTGIGGLSLVRKQPYLVYPGDPTEMQLLWQLSVTAVSTVSWGLDTSYSLGSAQTLEYGEDHQHAFTLTDLIPDQEYHYRVTAAGETYVGAFHPAPVPEATSLKFFAYGDTRTNPDIHDLIAGEMVAAYSADSGYESLLLCVGDLVSDGDSEQAWDEQFFAAADLNIRQLLAHLPFHSCMGNHEGSGALFTKYFPYPYVEARYWSFDYGPAHFIMVDQYTDYTPGSAQLDWIETDLAATTKPWRFICLHEPGWSAGNHPNNPAVQQYIQPLCEEYDVPIVFAGHNHYYARAVVNGVHHVTTGGGGAPLYDPDPGYPYVVAAASAHHYCRIEIDGSSLAFYAMSASAVLDSFHLTPATSVGEWEASPGIVLQRPYPNPFNPRTVLSFSLAEPRSVTLAVYDLSGRRVVILVDRDFAAGRHHVPWDGRDASGDPVASGTYLARMKAGGAIRLQKLLLVR